MNAKVKRCLKIIFFPLWVLYRFVKEKTLPLIRKFQDPKKVASRLYFKKFGRYINWQNPTELNEKIRWLQFNTDISLWTKLADKYLVREFVKEKGCENILIPLYGVWKRAEDIDFSKLPNSFVIKTNHGCGHVYSITNKNEINLEKVRRDLKAFMNQPFGFAFVETHYYNISRRIVAEKLLHNDLECSSSIVDYKFYCFKGRPLVCGVFYDRGVHKNVSFYDMKWSLRNEYRSEKLSNVPQKDIPIPSTFAQMKETCLLLASDFPFVRLDFYESEGKLYFGELTFTPAALSGGSLSMSALKSMGEMVELPNNEI